MKRISRVLCTAFLCICLALPFSTLSFAAELPAFTTENSTLLWGENAVQLEHDDLSIYNGGAPIYFYFYVSPRNRANFFREQEINPLTYMKDATTWQQAEHSFYGADAQEVAELSEGKVYLVKFHTPTGTAFMDKYVLDLDILWTNIEENGHYYLYSETYLDSYDSDEIGVGFTITEDSYLLFGIEIGPGMTEEFRSFMNSEAELFSGEPTVETTDDMFDFSEKEPAATVVVEAPEPVITTEITVVTEPTQEATEPMEEDVETKEADWKVWVIGGICILALGFIALKYGTPKEK